ncbi:MAG: squalene/phytoene synthase family protein [Planctomycetota bacterium]
MSALPVTGAGIVLPTDDRFVASAAACRAIVRERAANFYWGLRLTPEPRRSALYAVYAWMRAGDDAVDDPGSDEERRTKLDRFECATRATLWGEGQIERDDSREPWWCSFAWAVETFGIERRVLEGMMSGLRSDLYHPDPSVELAHADDDALDGYCALVGSTVGEACVTVWGLAPSIGNSSREEALRLSRLRGIAFQRTNILRDFAEDLRGGGGVPPRVYLPRSTFDAHGLIPEQLASWSKPEACRALIVDQARRAAEAYRASAGLESMISPDCRAVLRAMTAIYRGVLGRIERDPRRVAAERVRLSTWRKAVIAVRCGLAPRLGLAPA